MWNVHRNSSIEGLHVITFSKILLIFLSDYYSFRHNILVIKYRQIKGLAHGYLVLLMYSPRSMQWRFCASDISKNNRQQNTTIQQPNTSRMLSEKWSITTSRSRRFLQQTVFFFIATSFCTRPIQCAAFLPFMRV